MQAIDKRNREKIKVYRERESACGECKIVSDTRKFEKNDMYIQGAKIAFCILNGYELRTSA